MPRLRSANQPVSHLRQTVSRSVGRCRAPNLAVRSPLRPPPPSLPPSRFSAAHANEHLHASKALFGQRKVCNAGAGTGQMPARLHVCLHGRACCREVQVRGSKHCVSRYRSWTHARTHTCTFEDGLDCAMTYAHETRGPVGSVTNHSTSVCAGTPYQLHAAVPRHSDGLRRRSRWRWCVCDCQLLCLKCPCSGGATVGIALSQQHRGMRLEVLATSKARRRH